MEFEELKGLVARARASAALPRSDRYLGGVHVGPVHVCGGKRESLCFTGSEWADWAVAAAEAASREQASRLPFVGGVRRRLSLKQPRPLPRQAVDLGRKLQRARLLSHVSTDGDVAMADGPALFRLRGDSNPPQLGRPLNSNFAWYGPARPATDVTAALRRRILGLYGRFLSEDGKAVDYEGMGRSQEFRDFVDAAAELQKASWIRTAWGGDSSSAASEPPRDPKACIGRRGTDKDRPLPWQVSLEGLTPEERTAMFINLYNIIIIHGTVTFGSPRTATERIRFFKGLSYVIGGLEFSSQVGLYGWHPSPPLPRFHLGHTRWIHL